VVVIRPPATFGLPMPPSLKRVVGVPGDPVPPEARAATRRADVVPRGMFVVFGDNVASTDSRTLGFFPATGLVAVVVCRLSAAR
jgi:type IV secretory pathway protease TraF